MGIVRKLYGRAVELSSFGPSFCCPCCGYTGRFYNLHPLTGKRLSAKCPRCSALERHRLQALVLDRIELPVHGDILHFAPEPFFRKRLAAGARSYKTADIDRPDVDYLVDVQALPFDDSSFDLVYASHVMEHVQDERLGLSEIARVLRPGGMAILPVPIIRETTEEYTAPNPMESMHWRAPGRDYFDRLSSHFSRVEVFDSGMFDEKFQPSILEPGKKTNDYVPVCRV